MTANELADINEWSCCAHSKQVSTMLRQQEDRINVLEANQKIELNIKEKALQYIAELEKEIEELKNDKNIDQMSKNDKNIDKISNPVAWMDKNGYVYGKHETRPIEADIPLYTHTQSHPIEPVAMRYDFDGYGYMYIDSGSGSDWKTREKGELLYTKPFFSQKPVAMMVKFDGFDRPEFTTTCSSAALKHPNYTALYDHPPIAFAELEEGQSIPLYEHPMRELSDEEVLEHLAELEHEQWMAWAKSLYASEPLLSTERRERWHDCFIPYAELSEEMKEHDRVWARKVLAILKKARGE